MKVTLKKGDGEFLTKIKTKTLPAMGDRIILPIGKFTVVNSFVTYKGHTKTKVKVLAEVTIREDEA